MIQQSTVHQTEQMVTYVLLSSHKYKVKRVILNVSEVSFVFFLTTDTTFGRFFHACYHAKIA